LSAPERTCVGCRSRHMQDELIRLALVDGRVTVAGQAPRGRSAYLCAREECLDKALKRAAFKRAFRSEARTDEVRQLFAQEIAERKAVS
jgi:predicted RNA-binding protein YlxR (DUF448 family)